MRIAHMAGQVREPQDGLSGAWRKVAGMPWTVAALRNEGRFSQALEAYAAVGDGPRPVWLAAIEAAELMADLGRRDEAWVALLAGRERIASTGSRVYEILSLLLEAKLALRLDHDLPRAARALADAERRGARTTRSPRNWQASGEAWSCCWPVATRRPWSTSPLWCPPCAWAVGVWNFPRRPST
ncbi:hypothetical protein ACFQ0G_06165 [Streptomyces chiangmaiensis]